MAKLKVAYIINDAAFFVSHRLCLALSVKEKGGDVLVITGKNVSIEHEKEAIAKLKKHNIPYKSCMYSQGFRNPVSEIVGIAQVIFYLINFRPSTVHSVTSKGNLIAVIALIFFKRVKFIMSVSGLGTIFIGNKNFKKRVLLRVYQILLNFLLKRLDYKIIFQNQDDFNQFKLLIDIDKQKIKFIQGSGVDTKYYVPSKTNSKEINILLPARILYEKGISEFVEAARIIKSRNIDANFFLAGDQNSLNPSRIPKETLSEWIKEGVIIYLDHQKDMKVIYHKMTIVCLPSWREGFPKVLMEAASCGLPTVTTDVPGCKHAIINEKTGLLVPLKNPKVLADKIQIIIENKKLQKMMGRAGRLLALNKFDIRKIIPQILALYE